MIVYDFGKKINKELAIALGFFDSVHIGHRAVIGKAIQYAIDNNIKSAVITYSNNPFVALGKYQKLIFTFEERLEKFEKLGVDIVIAQEFDQAYMQKDKSVFMDELINAYNIKYAVCGQDYRFGKGGQGDVKYLQNYFQKRNVKFEILDFIKENNLKVSSSSIRKLIEAGEMKKAQKLLGEPFSVMGVVTSGKGYGKSLGIPTVNINFQCDKVRPRQGVYITKTMFDGQSFLSITNVGAKPTFSDSQENIETHILDYDGDLYNRKIKIEFYDFLRPVKSFQTKKELISQIKSDIKAAKNYTF